MKNDTQIKDDKVFSQYSAGLSQALHKLSEAFQNETKKHLEERQKVMENLERGARITTHRINL